MKDRGVESVDPSRASKTPSLAFEGYLRLGATYFVGQRLDRRCKASDIRENPVIVQGDKQLTTRAP